VVSHSSPRTGLEWGTQRFGWWMKNHRAGGVTKCKSIERGK
jgi:hypothetical protein